VSDDRTTLRRLPDSWTATRVVGAVALGVTVLTLVVGAALVARPPSAHGDAGGRVERFYEEADASGMLAAFPDGTIPDGQEEAAQRTLERILRPGVGIAEVAEPVEASGVPVVRVRTGDGRDWCVRPDGGILPGCRVGTIPVETETDAGIEVVLADVGLALEGPAQLDLGLETTGSEQLILHGMQLRAADGAALDAELVQAINVIGQQVSPVDPAAPSLSPGSTFYATWLIDEELAGRDLELAWDDGVLRLRLSPVRWFVR
jgi:hypothetical protein